MAIRIQYFPTTLRQFLLLVLTSVIVLGCSSSKPTQSELKPFEIGQFPHELGTKWTYLASDSASKSVDTLTVLVASDTSTPPYGFSSTEFWITSAPGTSPETVSVLYNDSTVVLQNAAWPLFVYFPIVRSPEAVSVPAGKFSEAYKVSSGYRLQQGDVYFLVDYWLVKGIGVVKYELNANATTPQLHYSAELMQYVPAPSAP